MPDKQPDVEIINDEPEQQDELSQVVVDLEKKPEKQADQPKPVEAKISPEITKLNNTIAYQTRKFEQAMKELQEMRQQLAQRPVQQTVQKENKDDIDIEAEKDWKKGVKMVVEPEIEAKIQAAFEKREQAQKELQRKANLDTELDRSKRKVLDRYPQIEDESSEEAALYRQVINEDTSVLSNVHGPEIAMYRMEERMRQMGKIPQTVRPVVDREVNRLTRAGASNVVGRQASPNGKITLTKEQKEFCDHYSIPYEQYAKNLKADAVGGVEI